MPRTTFPAAIAVLSGVIVAFSAACSGNANSIAPSPGGPCTASSASTTITISSTGVCPQNIVVPRGTQVTFVNSDSQPHDMESDPHPEHTDCPEIAQAGYLVPGQRRQTGNLNIARRCGFHDHINFSSKALQGSITVQ